MKNFFKNLQQWFSIGIGIAFALLLSGIAYAAWDYSTTVNIWDSLTAEKWNSVKDKVVSNDASIISNSGAIASNTAANVPSWAVMSFNLVSCPTGWSKADGTSGTPDLRWTFIRWMEGDANGRDVTRALWNYQTDEFESHDHQISIYLQGNWGATGHGSQYNSNGGGNWRTSSAGWSETRPKNIVLLYCVKD